MTAADIHAVLMAEAAKKQLPKSYQRDLTVHDLNELAAYGTQFFIWVLRTNGTFIVPLDHITPTRGNWPHHVMKAICSFGDTEMYYYIFRNGKLHPTTGDLALQAATEAAHRYEYIERRKRLRGVRNIA